MFLDAYRRLHAFVAYGRARSTRSASGSATGARRSCSCPSGSTRAYFGPRPGSTSRHGRRLDRGRSAARPRALSRARASASRVAFRLVVSAERRGLSRRARERRGRGGHPVRRGPGPPRAARASSSPSGTTATRARRRCSCRRWRWGGPSSSVAPRRSRPGTSSRTATTAGSSRPETTTPSRGGSRELLADEAAGRGAGRRARETVERVSHGSSTRAPRASLAARRRRGRRWTLGDAAARGRHSALVASGGGRRVAATEVDRVRYRRGRADLALFHEYAPPPSGGGHQFLRALRRARAPRPRGRAEPDLGCDAELPVQLVQLRLPRGCSGSRATTCAWCTASTGRSASTAGSTTAPTQRIAAINAVARRRHDRPVALQPRRACPSSGSSSPSPS